MRRTGLLAAIALLIISPAARAAECSCRNLESLQQEVANARYEAQFFADLANRLKALEDRLTEAKKDPANPDSSVSILAASAQEREAIMAREFRLPHPKVKDYTGPATVDMEPLTCSQKAADLDGLKNGAPCSEIGDISTAHEQRHSADCIAMGAEAYWLRNPSVIAAEEAARYADQAAAMEALLKNVIDKGTLTVEAVLEPHYKGPGFAAGYSYTLSRMVLKGHSSPGPGEWTLTGQGSQTGKILYAQIAGMSCTPSGQLNDQVDLTARTDGFKLSLDGRMTSLPGEVKIKCKKGMGMSMRPDGEVGGGSYFSGLDFLPEMPVTRDVSTLPFAQLIKGSGISVSGAERLLVKLECPGD